MAACSFDDAGRDGITGRQILVITHAIGVFLEVATDSGNLAQRFTFQAPLGRHLSQASNNPLYFAVEDSQQAVAGECLLVFPLRMKRLGRSPDVARYMQDVEDVGRVFRRHVKAGVCVFPQAGLAVHQPYQPLAWTASEVDLLVGPSKGFDRAIRFPDFSIRLLASG